MSPMPYLSDRSSVQCATTLISEHGAAAGLEAAARADKSRTIGNVRQYCRWRQIERLILVLSGDHAISTVH